MTKVRLQVTSEHPQRGLCCLLRRLFLIAAFLRLFEAVFEAGDPFLQVRGVLLPQDVLWSSFTPHGGIILCHAFRFSSSASAAAAASSPMRFWDSARPRVCSVQLELGLGSGLVGPGVCTVRSGHRSGAGQG